MLASWGWTTEDGFQEVPFERIEVDVTCELGADGNHHVSIDGLSGNAGEKILFRLDEFLDACNLVAGLVQPAKLTGRSRDKLVRTG